MSAYSYSKLFAGILMSTVWCEQHTTRLVWITMLAASDPKGRVLASIPGLASIARVTVPECESALATFLAPDPYSRTPDNEGRRIEEITGGWRLLNYEHYRELRDPDARKDQNREAQRRSRSRQHTSAEVLTEGDKPQESAQAEVRGQKSKESKSEEQGRSRGSRLPADWSLPADWKAWACAERPDLDIDTHADLFADYWHSKAGKDGCKANWLAAWRYWIRKEYAQPSRSAAPAQRACLTERSVDENRGFDLREGRHATAR